MKKILFFVCLAGALLCASDVTVSSVEFDSSPEGKKRYLSQPYSWWGRGKFPAKADERGMVITLTNARTRYVFFLYGKTSGNGAWHPQIGMLKPSRANWATGGFLDFSAGKVSMKKCAASVSDIGKGGFTLNFTAPDYKASCRIELKKDDDRLYVLFKAPRQTTVTFTAYPSSYGISYSRGKALRKRYAVTSAGRIEADKSIVLDRKVNAVFLGDSYFDPAKNRGEGPCGIIFDPRRCSARLSLGNYAAILRFTGKGELPFVLMDFNGVSNAEGERYMKEVSVKLH